MNEIQGRVGVCTFEAAGNMGVDDCLLDNQEESMLSKAMIRNRANAASYSKGVDLYNKNYVKEFSVEEDEIYDDIIAVVKGSGRNRYEVRISYDKEEDEIGDIDCECPAFESYSGICKHCVAVLLEYEDFVSRQKVIAKIASDREAAVNKLNTMKGFPQGKTEVAPKRFETTPTMKQLLTNQVRKRTLLAVQDTDYGKIQLEPHLSCTGNSINLEFKIGLLHKYVLKDIFAFDQAIENNEHVTYGQKLQFTHTIEAFDSQSRPIVQFVRNWVYRYKNNYKHQVYYGNSYGYSQTKLKIVPLHTTDLEEMLEAANNGSLLADINGTGEKVWQVTEDKLPRKMTINGNKDGIQVTINYLFGFQCKQHNIYFHEDKIYRIPKSDLMPIWGFMKCMAEIPNRTVNISREDVPAFCRELLPVLEKHFTCVKKNFEEKDYGILPAGFEIYLDAPQRDFITCKVMAVYGDNKYNIYNQTKASAIRDMVSEAGIGSIVSSFCNAFDEGEQVMVVAEDEDKIYEFLMNGIPRLQEIAEVFVSDALRCMKVIAAPRVSVGVSIAGNLLELKMTSGDMSREQLLEILTRYDRRKKFYRLKNGDFVNVADEEIASLLELKQGLHLTQSQLLQNVVQLPRYRALYLDAELKERKSLQVTKDKDFKSLIRNMKTVEDNDFDIPDCLEKVLREYQKRGYLWIKTLLYNGFGGILADDMGLGKTLQVICFLLSEYQESVPKGNNRALIVCPASLVYNWMNEMNKFAPQLPVKMIVGTLGERQELIQNSGAKDILVTSYDLLKRDIEYYDKLTFRYEIIDEAQAIKNFNTQAAKSVKMIHSEFKLALTGTPIENRLSELWSIFDYLMPQFLYSYQKFREEMELPIVQSQDKSAMMRLQKMITPFVLRRLKKDVLKDLPDKLEECVVAPLQGEQQKLYDAHVKKLQIILNKQSEEEFKNSKIQILSELTKLRQICCDPALLYDNYQDGSAKLEVCMDLIRDAISGGHKILLFSQFTSMLDRIQIKLQQENIGFYSLSGSTSKESRIKMVEEFNRDMTPVFCISLKAGGTGLNLTAADIVIHYDPWWNLAVQNQATDRAHRIGQMKVVNVYKLIVKGTIEENIMKLQEQKSELAEQVLGGEGISAGSFTREELLGLL